MKGMIWVWLAALLMGLGIVGLMDIASGPELEQEAVFAAQEETMPDGTEN